MTPTIQAQVMPYTMPRYAAWNTVSAAIHLHGSNKTRVLAALLRTASTDGTTATAEPKTGIKYSTLD